MDHSQKYVWLNVAVYAVTALIFGGIIWYISSNFDGPTRKLLIAVMLVAAYLFGKFANWFVKRVFDVDISGKNVS